MLDNINLVPSKETTLKIPEKVGSVCIQVKSVVYGLNYSLGKFDKVVIGNRILEGADILLHMIELPLYLKSAYKIFSGEVLKKKKYEIVSDCLRFTSSTMGYFLDIGDICHTYFDKLVSEKACGKLFIFKNVILITSHAISIGGKLYDMYQTPEERTRTNVFILFKSVCFIGLASSSLVSSNVPRHVSSIALNCLNLVSLASKSSKHHWNVIAAINDSSIV